MTRNVLSMSDLSGMEVIEVLDRSERRDLFAALSGKGVALVFEHPSARTRNAAEMATVGLGGHPVVIRGEEVEIDVRESAEDIARVLACYYALIGARVASHSTLERFAGALSDAGADVPIVNLLSDFEHPSQALADLLTIKQCFGHLNDVEVAYIGDANNVCRSLAIGVAATGGVMRVASPAGFALTDDDLDRIALAGGSVLQFDNAPDAARGAHVLYTDVWVSMGEEAKGARKRAALAGFTIDADLVGLARPDAIVLHCLPAHRGEEITADVLDGGASRVWIQAENRMHALRGLFSFLSDNLS